MSNKKKKDPVKTAVIVFTVLDCIVLIDACFAYFGSGLFVGPLLEFFINL